MSYVDGYVLAVPKNKIPQYLRIARQAGTVWRDHGALEYRECVGDDLNTKFGMSFRQNLKLKPGETAVFSWIVFKSKAHRDRVNAKVMKDPRIANMPPDSMPFDMKRMVNGGFKVAVDVTESTRRRQRKR